MDSSENLLCRSNRVFISVVFVSFFILAGTHAKAGWLEKGKDLLKGASSSGSNSSPSGLSTLEMAAGLKEALTVGSGSVVSRLGKSGGFNNDPAVHIPLPGSLTNRQISTG